MNTDSCAEDNERSPRITFLSGGTGTPKLIRGFRKVIPDENISVIVNTAEDMWIYGSHLSPDIDTLMYLFAGILNTDTWWGMHLRTSQNQKCLICLICLIRLLVIIAGLRIYHKITRYVY